jgi:hypothetical protein
VKWVVAKTNAVRVQSPPTTRQHTKRRKANLPAFHPTAKPKFPTGKPVLPRKVLPFPNPETAFPRAKTAFPRQKLKTLTTPPKSLNLPEDANETRKCFPFVYHPERDDIQTCIITCWHE